MLDFEDKKVDFDVTGMAVRKMGARIEGNRSGLKFCSR